MTEILEWICEQLELEGIEPVIGALPVEGKVAIAIGSGTRENFLARTGVINLSLVVNSKSKSQKEALDLLSETHDILTRKNGSTRRYQIADIRVQNVPSYLGQENDESYLYGSSLTIALYDKRGKL